MKRINGYKGAGVIVFCKSDDVLSKSLASNTIKQDYYLLLGKRKYNCLKFRIKDIFYWFTKSGRQHLRHAAKPIKNTKSFANRKLNFLFDGYQLLDSSQKILMAA